jgi:multidrug efflux pump subunit AcrB
MPGTQPVDERVANGMVTSTVLIMFVLPAMYTIMEDIGFVKLTGISED